MSSAPFSTTRNKQSLNLKTSLFLTVCRKAVLHTRGYLHSSSKIAEASVQGWFPDARIPPETTCWKPVWPGKNGVWRQDPQIQATSAACEDSSRQLEHCIKGSRPDAAWKGGRHKMTPVAPGEGDSAATGGAGVKRGRQRNPPAAAEGDNHDMRRRMCGSNSPK